MALFGWKRIDPYFNIYSACIENDIAWLRRAIASHGGDLSAIDINAPGQHHLKNALRSVINGGRVLLAKELFLAGGDFASLLESLCVTNPMIEPHFKPVKEVFDYLQEAIAQVKRFNELLASDADVNAADERGSTALMDAAQLGHMPTIRALLARGACLHARSNNGYTVLHIAVISQNVAAVRLFADSCTTLSQLNARINPTGAYCPNSTALAIALEGILKQDPVLGEEIVTILRSRMLELEAAFRKQLEAERLEAERLEAGYDAGDEEDDQLEP